MSHIHLNQMKLKKIIELNVLNACVEICQATDGDDYYSASLGNKAFVDGLSKRVLASAFRRCTNKLE